MVRLGATGQRRVRGILPTLVGVGVTLVDNSSAKLRPTAAGGPVAHEYPQ